MNLLFPKVSIIIPCYNAERWIARCVSSALGQNYPNIEVIYVDNESTDESMQIVKDKFGEEKNLIISSAENIYPDCWDEAREKGFQLSDGEYLLTIGADDYLDPLFISNCMQYIATAPASVLAFQSAIRGVNNDSGIEVGDVGHIYKTLTEFKQICMIQCPVNTPTVIFNRRLYEDGLLKTDPESYSGAADYDLYCKLADNNVFIYPAPMWLGYYYRWHEDQATWNMQKKETNYDKLIQDFWREKWFPSKDES